MDSDLWTSRLAAAKRQYSLQHHQNSQLDRLSVDDFGVEEEVRPDFPCPYCYEDYDVASLCSHLEDEHPFESKVAVCPICSVKVSRDMLNHITLQHGHLFKLQRCRRLRRVAIPNSQALSLLGRDLREAHLQVLLGGSGYRSTNNIASNGVSDSFFSSLVFNFPGSEAEEISKAAISNAEETYTKNVTASQKWKSRPTCICDIIDRKCCKDLFLYIAHPWRSYFFNATLSHEEREQKLKQVTVRATFVQDLLLSTMFGN